MFIGLFIAHGASDDLFLYGVHIKYIYYRLIGNFGISEIEIDQVQIITSGISACFDVASGAITNSITKSPSSQPLFEVPLESSKFLDALAANRPEAFF